MLTAKNQKRDDVLSDDGIVDTWVGIDAFGAGDGAKALLRGGHVEAPSWPGNSASVDLKRQARANAVDDLSRLNSREKSASIWLTCTSNESPFDGVARNAWCPGFFELRSTIRNVCLTSTAAGRVIAERSEVGSLFWIDAVLP